MSKLLPVDLETQKGSLWLKAFRVLDACIKGVQPFVGLVMQRLHDKVIAIVKANVICDTGGCADDDWDCITCKQADGEAHFTEDWPLILKICSMDTFGVADLAAPHHLKPHIPKIPNCNSTRFSAPVGLHTLSGLLLTPKHLHHWPTSFLCILGSEIAQLRIQAV